MNTLKFEVMLLVHDSDDPDAEPLGEITDAELNSLSDAIMSRIDVLVSSVPGRLGCQWITASVRAVKP